MSEKARFEAGDKVWFSPILGYGSARKGARVRVVTRVTRTGRFYLDGRYEPMWMPPKLRANGTLEAYKQGVGWVCTATAEQIANHEREIWREAMRHRVSKVLDDDGWRDTTDETIRELLAAMGLRADV